jgi:hypothetical protein
MTDSDRLDILKWGTSLKEYMVYRRTLSTFWEMMVAVGSGKLDDLSDGAQVLCRYTTSDMDYTGVISKLEQVLQYTEESYGTRLTIGCNNYMSQLGSRRKEYCVEFNRDLDELPEMFGFEVAGHRDNPHSQIEQYLLEELRNGDIEFVQGGGGAVLATNSKDVARAYIAMYISCIEQRWSSPE